MIRLVAVVLAPALVLAVGPALAAELDSRGELGFESRVFKPDDVAATRDGNFATFGRLFVDGQAGRVSARARLFTRFDPGDRARSVFFPEELWAEVAGGPLRLRVGYQMINWTATEAFHPADVINSRYFDSALENPEKLGEPMASLRCDVLRGNIELFFMPMFIEPVFPSARSRYNLGPPGMALGEALVLERDGDIGTPTFVPQGGLRLQQTLGAADVSVHLLHQIDRNLPLVVFDAATMSARPLFQPVTQLGGTYQHAIEAVLVKVEVAYRWYHRPDGNMSTHGPLPERDHLVGALGFEYNVPHDSGSESTWLLEGQVFVPREDVPRALEPLFQHDALLGYRYAFNDEDSRSLTLVAIVDVARPQEFLINAGYGQRLGETWGLQAGARVVRVPPRDPTMPVLFENLNNAHQLYLNLIRYF